MKYLPELQFPVDKANWHKVSGSILLFTTKHKKPIGRSWFEIYPNIERVIDALQWGKFHERIPEEIGILHK